MSSNGFDARQGDLVFLKLGGSLITDKTRPETVAADVLQRLAQEVVQARAEAPDLHLLVGHGSGSFGHMAASRHGTRHGVQGAAGWQGFAEVADAAARLNRLVVAAFLAAGVPVWSVQPSAGGWCEDGHVARWQVELFQMALAREVVPLTYGDAMLDVRRGGTIASTEELFVWLAERLRPQRIVLAGTVDGVYSADPLQHPDAMHWPLITPQDLPALRASLGGSHGVDVTGGMLSKVTEMCRLAAQQPGLEVRLVSGLRPGAVAAAVLGRPEAGGTVIRAS
ncbi:MAG: isopentenyl phosphate kinase [Caldilineales bacterium]|nr:isopentenyl phosphate kinase [Caldilineales bacterium]MDW8317232.1 isopentenyl phosphate kinase [Anaerolineae bacterium]